MLLNPLLVPAESCPFIWLTAPKKVWSYGDIWVKATKQRDPCPMLLIHQQHYQPGSDFSLFIAQEAVRSRKKPVWFLGSGGKKRKPLLTCELSIFGCGHRNDGLADWAQQSFTERTHWPADGQDFLRERHKPCTFSYGFSCKKATASSSNRTSVFFYSLCLPPPNPEGPFLRTEYRPREGTKKTGQNKIFLLGVQNLDGGQPGQRPSVHICPESLWKGASWPRLLLGGSLGCMPSVMWLCPVQLHPQMAWQGKMHSANQICSFRNFKMHSVNQICSFRN